MRRRVGREKGGVARREARQAAHGGMDFMSSRQTSPRGAAGAGRVSGHVKERRLKSDDTALYSYVNIPAPEAKRGYRVEARLIGRLWTRGGRPRAGYVTRRMPMDVLRERVVDVGRRLRERPERAPMPRVAEVADTFLSRRAPRRSAAPDPARLRRRVPEP